MAKGPAATVVLRSGRDERRARLAMTVVAGVAGQANVAPNGEPLYDLGARMYAPSLGAWTSLDAVMGSAQDPLSLNRFLYAEANPATLIDPTGHMVAHDEGGVCNATCRALKQAKEDAAKQNNGTTGSSTSAGGAQSTASGGPGPLDWFGSTAGGLVQGVGDTLWSLGSSLASQGEQLLACQNGMAVLEGRCAYADLAAALVEDPTGTQNRIAQGLIYAAANTAGDVGSGDPRRIGRGASNVVLNVASVGSAIGAVRKLSEGAELLSTVEVAQNAPSAVDLTGTVSRTADEVAAQGWGPLWERLSAGQKGAPFPRQIQAVGHEIHNQTFQRLRAMFGDAVKGYNPSGGIDFTFNVGGQTIKIELTTPPWQQIKADKYGIPVENVATYTFPRPGR